jgi:hypothetical protein
MGGGEEDRPHTNEWERPLVIPRLRKGEFMLVRPPYGSKMRCALTRAPRVAALGIRHSYRRYNGHGLSG